MLAFRIIKDTFIKFYDKLFKLILLNLILITALVIPLYILYQVDNVVVLIISTLYIFVLIGPMSLSALNYIKDALDYTEDTTIKDFLRGIKENFSRGFFAFLFTLIVYIILSFDVFFFWTRADNIFMFFVAIIFLYLFICFTFMQIYFWGLLSIREKDSIRLCIKNSFIVAIDNLFSTFFLLVFMLIFVSLCFVLPVMVPFFLLSTVFLIFIIATDYTMEKYRSIEEEAIPDAEIREGLAEDIDAKEIQDNNDSDS
ncbi:YesL family protein [Natronospora cellulosivora (SeqCode)]